MKKWQSFSALKKVVIEIESQANRVADALEHVIATPVGDEKTLEGIREPAQSFSGIADTLNLLGFSGLSLLASEMSFLLAETLDEEDTLAAEKIDAHLELCFVVLLHFPALLEDALAGSGDSFERVLTLLNRMRNARNAAPVFAMEVLQTRRHFNFRRQFEKDPGKLAELLEKQAPFFAKACETLKADPDNAKAREILAKVINNLELVLRDFRAGTLWGLAAALLEVLESKKEGAQQTVKLLAWLGGKLDEANKQGISALNEDIDDSTRQSLLSELKENPKAGTRTLMALRWFGVNDTMNREAEQELRQIQVRFYAKGALKSTLANLGTEIATLLDAIDHFSEQSAIPSDKVNELRESMGDLEKVMAFLGMHNQAQALKEIIGEQAPLDPATFLLDAAKLLFTTSRELNNRLENLELELFAPDADHIVERDSARLHTVQAAMEALQAVIDSLDECTEKGEQSLVSARGTLDHLSGVFTMMGLDVQSGQAGLARDYLRAVPPETVAELHSAKGFQSLCHLVINLLWYLEQLTLGKDSDSQIYLAKSEDYAGSLQECLAEMPIPEPVEEPVVEAQEEPEQDDEEIAGQQAAAETVIGPDAGVALEQASATATGANLDNVGDVPPEQQHAKAVTVEDTPATDVELSEEDEIKEIFAEEFDGILTELIQEREILAGDPMRHESIGNCRRHFHTIKGSGRMVGAQQLDSLGQAMEKLYDRFTSQQLAVNQEVLALTGRVIEILPILKNAFMGSGDAEYDPADVENLCQQAAVLSGQATAAKTGDVVQGALPEVAREELPEAGQEVLAEGSQAQDTSTSMETSHPVEEEDDITAFCHELEKFISDISGAQESGTMPTSGSDLALSMHRVYGDAGLYGLESYCGAVREVEKALLKFSGLPLSSEADAVLGSLGKITAALKDHIHEHQETSEYPHFAEDLVELDVALAALEPESEDSAEQTGADSIITGFLAEARDLVGRIADNTAVYINNPDSEAAEGVRKPLHLLKGAAESAGLDSLIEMATALDTLYARLAEAGSRPETQVTTHLAQAHEWFTRSLVRLEKGEQAGDCTELTDALAAALDAINIETEEVIAGQDDTVSHEADESLAVEITTPELEESVDSVAELEVSAVSNPDPDPVEQPAPVETPEQEEALTAEASVVEDEREPLDQDLISIFLEEAEELLDEMDELYLRWQETPADNEVVNEYLRILHTIKGSAALAQDDELSKAAHDYETFIIAARNQKVGFDEAFFTACDEQLHGLHDIRNLYVKDESGLIFRTRGGEIPVVTEKADIPETGEVVAWKYADEADNEKLNSEDRDIEVDEPEVTVPAGAVQQAAEVQTVAEEQVKVSSQLLKYLLNDADEINFSRNRIEKSFHDISGLLVDMDDTLARLKSYVKRFDDTAKQNLRQSKEIKEENEGSRISDEFDALEMDRFTELQEMSLSLSEDYEDLQEIRTNLSGRLRDIDNILVGQQRLTHSLQDGLISSQMVPFASIIPRLRRLVRQTSRELGKNVRFEVENQQGNLDKNVLQGIITPFEHIIRNAIDHGLETVEERKVAGKPEQAVILTRVTRQGASIVIEIRDDGRGINAEKVRQRAIEKGVISAAANIGPEDACQLIFAPGFTTADSVSKISGRGVGLDVVKSEISELGGSVEVFTQEGRGTSFVMHLPLTSSLNRALLFEIQELPYVVLMNTLDGVLVEKLSTVLQMQKDNGRPVFEYGAKTYEYLYLGKLVDRDLEPRPDSVDSAITLLLVSGKDRNFALHVDKIIENKDLVVQALNKQLASMPGIGGGVIMADGDIAIVLDLPALATRYSETGMSGSAQEGDDPVISPVRKERRAKRRKTIMVVDDSITVRKITAKLLERHGMNVITAKDGIEAIEVLEQRIPDVMLLDIEMPRMDGLELATYIRKQESPIKDIPIIMITSRIGDKHRNRAESIGVNEYLCKPFVEETLLEHIDSF